MKKFDIQLFANVIHGNSSQNRLTNTGNNTQIYGLAGNDTIESVNKKNAFLIGGSGNDVLQMSGGSGSINGGAGKDTFYLSYSASATLSAVIEDIDPANDKLVINYEGSDGTPKINYSTVGKDVILTDDKGYLNVTLKGTKQLDSYYDGECNEYIWDVLRIVNQEREKVGVNPLTLSQDLTDGAAIRATESITRYEHIRPNGSAIYTVLKSGNQYVGENLYQSPSSPEAAMEGWMNSTGHRENILNAGYNSIGIGYTYSSNSTWKHYWAQMFSNYVHTESTNYLSTNEFLSTKLTLSVKGVTKSDSTLGNIVALQRTNLNGTAGNDLLINGKWYGEKGTQNLVITGGNGSDTISNSGSNSVLDGGNGADLIYNGYYYYSGDWTGFLDDSYNNEYNDANGSSKVTISGGAGKDSIQNKGNQVSISGGADDDSIKNAGDKVTINADAGNDFIINGEWFGSKGGKNITINGGEGNDTISNSGSNSVLDGGNGADLIYSGYYNYYGSDVFYENSYNNEYNDANGSSKVSISGGAGNDSINNRGANSTIAGGAGDDYIYNSGSNVMFVYNSGDGNDTISGFSANDTIQINSGKLSNASVNGSDVRLTIGTGYIILTNAKNKNITVKDSAGTHTFKNTYSDSSTVPASPFTSGDDYYSNDTANTTLNALGGDDTVYNYANKVVVNGGAGKDYLVSFSDAKNVTLKGDADNDTIYSWSDKSYIDGGDGADYLVSDGSNHTIIGGKGNDTVFNYDDYASISGGEGNDDIYSGYSNASMTSYYNHYATVNAGAGNDFISLSSSSQNYLIQYNSGDGKDTVYGLDSNDTLQITGAEYTTTKNAFDLIIGIGNGSITVAGGANVAFKIDGTLKSNDEDGLSIKGAILTASSKFKGSKINLSNYSGVSTVNASALSQAVTILGDANVNSIKGGKGADTIYGYEGNDSIYGGAGNDYLYGDDGNDSIFGGSGNDTVSLGGGADVYIYSAGNDLIQDYTAGADKIRLSGVSITGASVSGSNVILKTSGGNITVKGGKDTALTIIDSSGKETTQKYPAETLQTGLSIKNSILTASTKFTDKTIDLANYPTATKVNASALSKAVSIVGTAANNSIKGGKGADTIFGGSGNDTVSLGGGADVYIYSAGNDLIQDYTAGADKIKLSSGSISGASISGSNVILKTSSGNITVKDGKGKNITVIDSKGKETTQIYPAETLPAGISIKSSVLTASSSFKGKEIDLADYSKVTKVNASALSKAVSIVGSAAANSLVGGKSNDTLFGGAGNDTLTGGSGKDTFIYSAGKDVITDYAAGDKIKISSGKISKTSYSGKNVIFTIGSGTLTVKNAKGTKISVTDSSGTKTYSKTLDLFEDNNFITEDAQLSEITASKVSVTQIQENKSDIFAQDSTILTLGSRQEAVGSREIVSKT